VQVDGAILLLDLESGSLAAGSDIRLSIGVWDAARGGIRVGGDHIVITGGGGPDSPLVVYGDTSQDGVWYSGEASAPLESRVRFGPKPFPTFDPDFYGDSLILHRHVHLGIAVDLDRDGLVVAVIREAQRRSVAELAAAIAELSRRARSGALRPEELAGSTYTLSNSGTFGTFITAPIINPPEVAILSLDAVQKRPVVIEGEHGDALAVRPIGVLAQSFDHRAFDGANSAPFLAPQPTHLAQPDW
jgi:hypothetical protein